MNFQSEVIKFYVTVKILSLILIGSVQVGLKETADLWAVKLSYVSISLEWDSNLCSAICNK